MHPLSIVSNDVVFYPAAPCLFTFQVAASIKHIDKKKAHESTTCLDQSEMCSLITVEIEEKVNQISLPYEDGRGRSQLSYWLAESSCVESLTSVAHR